MKAYITIDGDMVDRIAWLHYGTTEKTTEALLDTNRFLAQFGPVLPGGLALTLPKVEAPPVGRAALKLWD